MKLYNFILFTCLSVAISFTVVSCNNNHQTDNNAETDTNGIPPLQDRKGALANAPEWQKIKDKVSELIAQVTANPSDVRPRLRIAMIYMNEVRITGNSYYYTAIPKILDGIMAIEPNNFEAHVFKASVAMSLHQFAIAKQLAETAKNINPDNAYVYGVLVDANVELGNYDEAIRMSDKMQSLKPSLEAYSRASYLREIFGDYPGAIAAMKMAVQAGAPGTESAEWSRVALGDLYLNTGKTDSAKYEYETSLSFRPEFPNAEIGLAKVDKAKKNYNDAIKHTENAIRIVSESAFVSMLGDLYELNGNADKAKNIRADVIKGLEEGKKDAAIKHNANREFANAYLAAKDYKKAMEYAQNDLNLRPENIDANELCGWIAYLQGDYTKATGYAEKSLHTHTKNAGTLYKAGLIYKASGNIARANELINEAQSVNPYIDQRIILAAK